MITVPELAADALGSFLASDMKGRFGSSHARLTELIPSVARLALECIGNSDALYHNVEHTMLVTLVGHDIMRGRACSPPRCPATTHISSWRALCMTLVTFAASSQGTGMTESLSTREEAKRVCRADPPM